MSRIDDLFGLQTNKYQGAPCTEVDPELFFLDPTEENKHLPQLRMICSSCPFLADNSCLQDALDNDDQGFRAGLTYRQRKKIVRERGAGQGRASRKGKGVNFSRIPRVLDLRSQGLQNYLIAQSMGISTKSVERTLTLAVQAGLIPGWGRGDGVLNANKTHCHKGHEFTPENTYLVAQRGGTARNCRTCKTEWQVSYRKGKKVAA